MIKNPDLKLTPFTVANYKKLLEKKDEGKIGKEDFKIWHRAYVKAMMDIEIAKNPQRGILVLSHPYDGLPEFLKGAIVHRTYKYRYIPMEKENPAMEQVQTAAWRLLEFRTANGLSKSKMCELINKRCQIYRIRWTVDDITNYECLNQSPKMDKLTALRKGLLISEESACGFGETYVSPVVKDAKEKDPNFSSSYRSEKTARRVPAETPVEVEEFFQAYAV